MGFKSKIMIGAPLVLNELPKYRDKIIMLATIGHEPCYGTLILVGTFSFVEGFFIGDLTAFPISMHHYAVAEKK